MKFHTTRKAIVNGYTNIHYAGYCDLQSLLHYKEPAAYTSGVYGWNFDVYHVHGVTVCTGYRGMPGERLEGTREYEEKAKAIVNNWNMPYAEKKQAVELLLIEFCKLNGGYEE